MTDLTPIAQDYVKAIWSATEWGGAPITVSALAERFGTTRATASDTIRRLVAQSLVRHEPYQPIELSPLGRGEALRMVRRHRLLETFLVTTLGYPWHQVHDEAERLEHAASDELIERMDELLGHPDCDPHGDPIPSRDGRVHHPEAAVALRDAAPGRYRVLRVSDADPDRLVLFAEHGVMPGRGLRVLGRDGPAETVTVGMPGHARLALAGAALDAIILGDA